MADQRHSVVVVGASAAGLRCACRLARLRPEARIRVVDARPVISVAACGLPYVLSGDVGDRQALILSPYSAFFLSGTAFISTTSPPVPAASRL